MKKAIYAGSFDPPTNGHLWMIEQGARLFGELIVAIGVNPDKEYTFSLDERVEVLKNITRKCQNIRIDTFENQFLVDYARSVGAAYILRGIRSESDYEYERAMRNINSDLDPNIVTVFLMPPREIAEINSSICAFDNKTNDELCVLSVSVVGIYVNILPGFINPLGSIINKEKGFTG